MDNNLESTELQKHTESLDLSLSEGLNEIKNTNKNHDLDQVKSKYLGRGSSMSNVMSTLRNASPELKKQIGELTNKFKSKLENAIATQREFILEQELNEKLALETIDVTVNGSGNKLGSLHPVSLSEQRMIDIFKSLGFDIADGPEIETDRYNFEALNIPKDHPARAMQDTFYTETGNVLRTHTSPMQVRYAEIHTPPIKVIAPGRVYRVDMDATHSPMFHQLEGLWVEKNISFANLKGVMIEFLKRFFENENLEVRFRSSFFPFTEPSAEIDIMSKNGKWLEVAGCGMVHPNVLQAMNIDSEEYSGFAFGIGIDRFTMLRYGINDLRLMFESNLDFLNQFQSIN
jgi:phenylalanyl-tRNA synthetase alpha chain